MGETTLTTDDMTAALLEAMRRVVPRHVELSPSTALDRAGIDSLALIETMIHLESLVGLLFDESAVRQAVLQPDYDPGMSVERFGALLLRLVDPTEVKERA
jgi:acyl carrier protein